MEAETAQTCAEAGVLMSEKRMRERSGGDEDEVRTETEETDKGLILARGPSVPGSLLQGRSTPAPARPHALILPAAANTAPRPGRPPPTPAAAGPAPRAPGAGGRATKRAGGEGCRVGATMWFQLTLFFFPLFLLLFLSKQGKCSTKRWRFSIVFSSLTRVPAPVRVQKAGGAEHWEPLCAGRDPGRARGVGPFPRRHAGCSRPARTPSRRAQLARGPSAALCCAPPPPEPGSC